VVVLVAPVDCRVESPVVLGVVWAIAPNASDTPAAIRETEPTCRSLLDMAYLLRLVETQASHFPLILFPGVPLINHLSDDRRKE
jgi:hypothetical protein